MSNIFALELNSTSNFYIKFYPGIKTSIGCEKATLILGRLEYWFEKYKNGFYKFIEPCEHPLYREGDSWLEEIGFSRKIFAKSFDLIGVRYKSKSAFKKAEDKFQGKLYASYHDRKTNQTYFVRNHQFAAEFIKSLFKNKNKQPAAYIKPKKAENIKNAPSEISSPKKGRSRNGNKGCSYGGTIGGKENNPIQRNTSSLEHDNQKANRTSPNVIHTKETEGMIKIWEEEIGDLGVFSVSDNLVNSLTVSLKQFFNQSLDQWQSYCRMIASSKFLMGEAQNRFFKKAWITWAIKEESIEKVRGGGFNLGDRETKLDQQFAENRHELADLERKKQQVEEKINSLNSFIKEKRDAIIKEKIDNLSDKESKKVKKEYEKFLTEENSSISKEFKKNGWQGLFVEAYFCGFLREKLNAQIFSCSLETEISKAVWESGFTEELAVIQKNIDTLKANHEKLKRQQTSEETVAFSHSPSLMAA